MKKLLVLFLFLLSVCSVNARFYSYNCYSDKPAYIYNNYAVWYASDLTIQPGSAINAGLRFDLDFSTHKLPVNGLILAIGVSENQKFSPAFELVQNGQQLQLKRKVEIGSEVHDFIQDCWTPNLLKPLRNYHLVFEFDETRCRILLWERGNESNQQCEYTFYGIMSTKTKEILGTTTTLNHLLSMATNRDYYPNIVTARDLGYGVGVEVPPPPTQISWLKLENVNSGMNFSLYENATHEGISIVQRDQKTKGCADIWEMIPTYMPSRIPTGYNARLKNILTSFDASIKGCASTERIPLINENTSDCNLWLFYNPLGRTNKFNLHNRQHGLFAVVKDASKYDGTTIWTWFTGQSENSQWKIQKVEFPQAEIESGTYTLKNKYSEHCIVPKYIDYNYHELIQASPKLQNTTWYVRKQPNGLVTLQNVDTKEYMVTYNAELENRVPIVQWETAVSGNSKWIIKKAGIYHTLKNLNSDAYVQPDLYYPSQANVAIQQNTAIGEPMYWSLNQFSYGPKELLGGMYRIRHSVTGQILGVQKSSTAIGAPLIAKDRALDPSDWWTFIFEETGGVAVQNVRSNLFMDIEGSSTESDAFSVQSSRDTDKRGHSLWVIEPLSSEHVVRIKNVHSGKYLCLKRLPQPGENLKVTQVELTQETETSTVWMLEMIY